ncbi:hypothetical protein VI817_002258 [Penicillium citrinum]|nr:hypothetical protein VI817_002258 [Penicillium citrinum]
MILDVDYLSYMLEAEKVEIKYEQGVGRLEVGRRSDDQADSLSREQGSQQGFWPQYKIIPPNRRQGAAGEGWPECSGL